MKTLKVVYLKLLDFLGSQFVSILLKNVCSVFACAKIVQRYGGFGDTMHMKNMCQMNYILKYFQIIPLITSFAKITLYSSAGANC